MTHSIACKRIERLKFWIANTGHRLPLVVELRYHNCRNMNMMEAEMAKIREIFMQIFKFVSCCHFSGAAKLT